MQYARSSRNLGKPNVKGATPPIATVNALKVIEIQTGIDRAVCFTVPKVHQDFGLKEIGAKVEEKIDAHNFRPRHDMSIVCPNHQNLSEIQKFSLKFIPNSIISCID